MPNPNAIAISAGVFFAPTGAFAGRPLAEGGGALTGVKMRLTTACAVAEDVGSTLGLVTDAGLMSDPGPNVP